MRAALRIPAMMAWVTVLWVALWDDISFANVAAGLVIAVVIVLVLRLERPDTKATWFRPHWAAWYVAVVIWSLVVSNLKLAKSILSPDTGVHTSIVAVPMRGGSWAVVNVVANSITLTPGTMTVEVDTEPEDGYVLYIHSMFAQDPDSVRLDVLRLEELALRAFGSAADRERVAADVAAQERRGARTGGPA